MEIRFDTGFNDLFVVKIVVDAVSAHHDDIIVLDEMLAIQGQSLRAIIAHSGLVWSIESVLLFLGTEGLF